MNYCMIATRIRYRSVSNHQVDLVKCTHLVVRETRLLEHGRSRVETLESL